MNLTASIDTTVSVSLSPEVGQHLAAQLDTYHELCFQRKVLDAAIDTEKEAIGAAVLATGYEKLGIASSIVTLVRGFTTTLDQQKLIAGGVTLAQLKAATTTKPKKPYWKISGEGEE